MKNKIIVGVVGLGYVGLPLSIYLSKHFKTLGFDTSEERINQLKSKKDKNDLLEKKEIIQLSKISFYKNYDKISLADIIFVCLPTPVNRNKKPDMTILKDVCREIAKKIKRSVTIIFESTVYPGVTEEVCIPILEKHSKMKWKKDFNIGYSPERVSPGKNYKKIYEIKKIIAGDTLKTKKLMKFIYGKIIKAGLYVAESIKVAEAAKILENTQRDVNIALMNEISIIFKKLNIKTQSVISAAASKWNFNKYYPGLVGGHCIGVDPYYLTHKSKSVGHYPDLILTSRKINESISKIIFKEVKSFLQQKKIIDPKILLLGVSYKENCNDLRNSKINDLVLLLSNIFKGLKVCDPIVDKNEFKKLTGNQLIQFKKSKYLYDVVLLCQPHDIFIKKIKIIESLVKPDGLFYDVKGASSASRNNINYLQL